MDPAKMEIEKYMICCCPRKSCVFFSPGCLIERSSRLLKCKINKYILVTIHIKSNMAVKTYDIYENIYYKPNMTDEIKKKYLSMER